MKITKSELHKIIKEEIDSVSEGLAPGWMAGIFSPGPKKSKKQKPDEETVAKNKKAKKSINKVDDMLKQMGIEEAHGGEGKMAQNQLRRIAQLANEIADLFDNSSDLDEWVESKITKSQDYLSTVLNHLHGKADLKAAEEILATRMGSYAGTTLPGGKKIPDVGGTQSSSKPRLEPWME